MPHITRHFATDSILAHCEKLGLAILLLIPSAGISSVAHASASVACASSRPHQPMLITGACEDPDYNAQSFVIDRVSEVATPLAHTRVDAHFRASPGKPEFRVTIYLPRRKLWQGRFFQHAYPLEQPENPDDISFALGHGGYLVNVKGVPCGCGGYRPDAAAAKLARDYAHKFYASSRRIYGYLWGGSGGGLLTIGAAENTQGVWDGIAPYVMPNAGSLLNINALAALGHLALHDKLTSLADAVAPGSTRDPKEGLDAEQRAVFDEVLALGIPQRTFEGSAGDPSGGGALLMFLSDGVRTEDPTYVTDFWSKPGYEGVNPPPYLKAAVRDEMIAISEVKRNGQGLVTAIRLEHPPELGPLGPLGPIAFEYWLYRPDGKTRIGQIAGKIAGDTISVEGRQIAATPGRLGAGLGQMGAPAISDGLAVIAPGYRVRVNNLFNLALHYYHRHAMPTDRDMYPYDYLRYPDGTPRYPQRDYLASTAMAETTAGGGTQTGKILSKVIVNQSMLDGGAAPWMADWYAKRVRAALGPSAYDQMFRVYFNDNAVHFDSPPAGDQASRIISYVPALYQTILDLEAWAESGVAPLPSSRFTVSGGQLHLAVTAGQRQGMQPVVNLEVGGTTRAKVAVNQPVIFTGSIAVPPGAGSVTSTAWWFGDSAFQLKAEPVAKPEQFVRLTQSHQYTQPGTYFVTLWATSQRQGSASEAYTKVQNLARVRVIVH